MKPALTSLATILVAAVSLAITSCSSTGFHASKHDAFAQRSDYQKTMETFKDDDVYSRATQQNTKVRINLTTQRAQLLVGEDDEVAIDCPCTTGKSGKRTPAGTFKIMEKIVTKRSTIFGSLYRNGTKVYGGDRRKYRGRYDRYVGAPLPYWMRLTGDGIGMHYSRGVKRYPASNGCIRMPQPAVKQVFAKVRRGTPVYVVR